MTIAQANRRTSQNVGIIQWKTAGSALGNFPSHHTLQESDRTVEGSRGSSLSQMVLHDGPFAVEGP